MNAITLIGRLGKEPELRLTPSGVSVIRFSLAVDRPSKEKETDWFDCEAWRQNAEFAAGYAHKGRRVAVQGRMENHRWEDQEGKRRDGWKLVVDRLEVLEKQESGMPEEVKALPF
ncbi:MAG TPA: single-stranded DNA-binding protein [Chroococcales cyanobacterium]